jgi:hypothetical protein
MSQRGAKTAFGMDETCRRYGFPGVPDFLLNGPELGLFLLALALCFVARGSSIVSATFNVDDLWAWPGQYDFNSVGFIAFREGRFVGPFIAGLFSLLGINPARTFELSAIALMVCQSAAAVLTCRIWKIGDDWRLSAAAISLLVLHPYQADLSTWKIAQFPGCLPFVAVLWALSIANDNRAKWIASVVVIVLSLGIQQIPLEMASAILLFAVPIALARGKLDVWAWTMRVLALAAGTILYVVVAKLVVAYTAHAESLGRDEIILLSDPKLVIARSKELLLLFSTHDPLTGWLTRLLLVFLSAVAIIGTVIRDQRSTKHGVLVAVSLSAAAIGAYVCAVSLTVVPSAWLPVFRNMMSVEVIWAAIAVMALAVSVGRVQLVVTVSVCFIALGFIGSNNQILSDQQRVNRRDVLMASRIAGDIGHLDNYGKIHRVFFVGTTSKTLHGIETAADLSTGWHQYGTTLSAFAVPWPGYVVQLYNEVTGRNMGYQATSEEQEWAYKSCSKHDWPRPGSVFSQSDLAVVCLGAPIEVRFGPFDR